MKILIAAIGSRGDQQPLALLGRELVKAGLDVDSYLPDSFGSIMADPSVRNLAGRDTLSAIWSKVDGPKHRHALGEMNCDAIIFNPLIAPYVPDGRQLRVALAPYPGPADDPTWERTCGTPVIHAYSSLVHMQLGVYQPGYIFNHEDAALPSVGFGSVKADDVMERALAAVGDNGRVAIHHGGSGTTALALKQLRPSIVVPFLGDQFLWGRRIEEMGLGRTVGNDHSFEAIAEAVASVSADDQISRNLNAISDVISGEDATRQIAKTLLAGWLS